MRILMFGLILSVLSASSAFADLADAPREVPYYGPSTEKCQKFTGVVGYVQLNSVGEGWLKDRTGTEYLVVSTNNQYHYDSEAGYRYFMEFKIPAGKEVQISARVIPGCNYSGGHPQLDL